MSVAVGHLDARTGAHLDDVVRAIDEHVPVVEAYLVGSGAAGGFDPETSDVDVVVVVERELGNGRRRVVDEVREWSEQRDDEFARVNALRTRHYLEHGEWISK